MTSFESNKLLVKVVLGELNVEHYFLQEQNKTVKFTYFNHVVSVQNCISILFARLIENLKCSYQ